VVSPTAYLVLAAMLFSIGAVGLLVRRNPLVMFMCVELMLNSVNLTFITFGHELGDMGGEVSGSGDHRRHHAPTPRGVGRRSFGPAGLTRHGTTR